MYSIFSTSAFDAWFAGLKDKTAKARLQARIDRIEHDGHFGDTKPVGNGVFELRIDVGPGYRVYFKRYGQVVVLLLQGGHKKSQQKDIESAIELSEHFSLDDFYDPPLDA